MPRRGRRTGADTGSARVAAKFFDEVTADMGTPKQVAEECIAGVAEARIRSMMGEWLVYFRERMVGVIEDGRLFVTAVPAARALLRDAPEIPPHAGAKPRLVVADTSDKAFLYRLFEAMWTQLPAAKTKK